MANEHTPANAEPMCLVDVCDRLEKVRSQLLIAQFSFQAEAFPPGISSALAHLCEGMDEDLAEVEKATHAMLEAEREALSEG